MFPIDCTHKNSNGRMDLFALHGPIMNRHSVTSCFCKECVPIVKDYIKEQANPYSNKLASNRQNSARSIENNFITQPKEKPVKMFNNFFQTATKRIIDEEGIVNIWEYLCKKCKHHCENTAHIISGRQQCHILSDAEMQNLITFDNKNSLTQIMERERGGNAKPIVENLTIVEPIEFTYDRSHVET